MKERIRAVLSWAKKRWKPLTLVAVVMLLLASYPVLVLGYTWSKVLQSDLEGGRHGPLDAYRHALASAIVSYTLDERVVEWVSEVMEGGRLVSHRMDRHNNRIGASIGSEVSSFWDIEPAVARRVAEGKVMSNDPDQITWLPKGVWSDAVMW